MGRSFDEYLDMFDLSEEDLARDIVGIGDGPASFNVQMYQRGTPVISIAKSGFINFERTILGRSEQCSLLFNSRTKSSKVSELGNWHPMLFQF